MKKNAAASAIREMRMNSSKTSAGAVLARDRRSWANLITSLSLDEAQGRTSRRRPTQPGERRSDVLQRDVNRAVPGTEAVKFIVLVGPCARSPLIRRARTYHSVPANRTKILVRRIPIL